VNRLLAAVVFLLGAFATGAAGQAPPPADTPAATPAATPLTTPAAVPVWKPFQELGFLLGSWSGTAESGGRVGGRVAHFTMELGGSYLVHRGTVFLTGEDGKPDENIEEVGYFSYDREKRRYVALYLFSTGVSGSYDVDFPADSSVRLVSRELLNYESGAKARMLLARKSDTEVSLSMDLAAAGKDFVPFVASTLRKK
jgi:hypothetical protein